MHPRLIYLIVFISMLILMIILQLKYEIRSDNTYSRIKKLYSYAWVQLNWWPLFLVSATIAIIFETQNLPQLWQLTLVLLGIGYLTADSGHIIDIPDDSSAAAAQAAAQNKPLHKLLTRPRCLLLSHLQRIEKKKDKTFFSTFSPIKTVIDVNQTKVKCLNMRGEIREYFVVSKRVK
jgi:hypothetical protein